MIKLQGPETLRPLSLGKLCSFVQHALNTNLLIYYKTLLIKNNQYSGFNKDQSQDTKSEEMIKEIKSQLIELLQYHKTGLSLAQIPILYKKKFGNPLNIQVLGFPKLKNLLATMEEVLLEKAQGNFLKANLRTHMRKVSVRPLEDYRQKFEGNNRFYTLRNEPLDYRLNNPYYSNLGNALNSHQGLNQAPPIRCYRTVSTVEEYIIKVKLLLIEIMRENMYGIELEKLQQALDQKLGSTFDCKICKADNFQEFLVTHLDGYLDIELKKSLRPTVNTGVSYIVFPKQTGSKVFSQLRSPIFDTQGQCSNPLDIPSSLNQNLGFPRISNEPSLYNLQQPNSSYMFSYMGNKANSWNSVKSSDADVFAKKDPAPPRKNNENLSQAPPSNSTKSSRSPFQYNPFGGIDLQGLNLQFKRRSQRKKKRVQNDLIDQKLDSALQYQVLSPTYPRSYASQVVSDKEEKSSGEGEDAKSQEEGDGNSLESTSFRMVEQILDDQTRVFDPILAHKKSD